MCLPQVPFLKKEWFKSLKELHEKWGGKFDGRDVEITQEISSGTIVPSYATLLTNVKGHKIYLSREIPGDGPYLEIYVYGDWKSKLYLSLEGIHDKFLKAIGLEHEIILEGTQVDIILFNRRYLIKGDPEEFISTFLSDGHIGDVINSMGNFWMLNIKGNIAKIIYDIESSEIIRADNLVDKINHFIDFLDVLGNKESGK